MVERSPINDRVGGVPEILAKTVRILAPVGSRIEQVSAAVNLAAQFTLAIRQNAGEQKLKTPNK